MDITPNRKTVLTPEIEFFGIKIDNPNNTYSKHQPAPIFKIKDENRNKNNQVMQKKKSAFAFNPGTFDESNDNSVKKFGISTITLKFINLPVNMTTEQLNEIIMKESNICPFKAFVVKDKDGDKKGEKRSLRYAYVLIQGDKNADIVYEKFDGYCYNSCVISVIYVEQK